MAQGNHSANGVEGSVAAANEDLRILHFPHRSLVKYRAKIRVGGDAYARNATLPASMGSTWRAHRELLDSDGLETFWESISLTPSQAARGVRDGRFVKDSTVLEFLAQQDEMLG